MQGRDPRRACPLQRRGVRIGHHERGQLLCPVLERGLDRRVEQRRLRAEVVADAGQVGVRGSDEIARGDVRVAPLLEQPSGSCQKLLPVSHVEKNSAAV